MFLLADDEPEITLDDLQLDYSELWCPKCGCNDVLVIDLPQPARWYKIAGKARCNDCGVTFALQLDVDDA